MEKIKSPKCGTKEIGKAVRPKGKQQYQYIAFDKNENRIQNIADNSPKAKFYSSDANQRHQNVSFWGKHFDFNNKSHFFTV